MEPAGEVFVRLSKTLSTTPRPSPDAALSYKSRFSLSLADFLDWHAKSSRSVQGDQLVGHFVQGRAPTLEHSTIIRTHLAQEEQVSLRVEPELFSLVVFPC